MHRPALKHLRSDPVMKRVIDEAGPPSLTPRRQPTFQSITQAIVSQQLSGRVAEVILARFKKLFSKSGERFPAPKEVLGKSVAKLRTAGLSGAKANAIRDLARRTVDGLVPTLAQCDDLTDARSSSKSLPPSRVSARGPSRCCLFLISAGRIFCPLTTSASGADSRLRTDCAKCPAPSAWRATVKSGRRIARWPPGIFGGPPMAKNKSN